jgi:hypothetical protein
MEQMWQQLRKIKLSNISYKNYDEIVSACAEAWNCFVSEEGAIKTLLHKKFDTTQLSRSQS